MSEMVERVALEAWIAYRVRDEDMHSTDPWDYNRESAIRDWNESPHLCTHIGADGFRCVARAALRAMREPTEEMVGAGSDVVDDLLPFWARMVWLAMIDAALGEETKA